MTKNGKVLVVIPNYNGKTYIVKSIQSVLAQTYKPIEIVIVDNYSTDGSYKLVQTTFPNLRTIQNGFNAGWGIACNVGMKAAESEYILLLNNDAYMENNCVEEMVKALNLHPKYGACASRILLWDEPDKTEVCGLVIYRDGSSIGRGRLGPADRYMQIEEVFCANDCCALFRTEMFDDIGNYDPDFFLYCDETDIGWRHQLAGWKCIYAPDAIAYHAHSHAAGSYTPFKIFHVERNRIFLCIKYLPLFDIFLSLFYCGYRYAYQAYAAFKKKKGALSHYLGQHSFATGLITLIKAYLDAFSKFPVMWKRRREMRPIRRISDHEIRQLFKKFGIPARDMANYE